MEYALIDSGDGEKLERFGKYLLIRPCPQAIWRKTLPLEEWNKAHAYFERDQGNRWIDRESLSDEWTVSIENIRFVLRRTDFGHLGIFPEQAAQWQWIQKQLSRVSNPRVLNLFAYSGGSSLAASLAGAQVCHLDAAKGMVDWARENAELNGVNNIRWIVDDVRKFLVRELKRNSRYEGIILDPPSFGRGKSGEVFKIERDLPVILQQCAELLSERPCFLLFSCHTPGYTPIVLKQLLSEYFPNGKIEAGEMLLQNSSEEGFVVPSGSFARWIYVPT